MHVSVVTATSAIGFSCVQRSRAACLSSYVSNQIIPIFNS